MREDRTADLRMRLHPSRWNIKVDPSHELGAGLVCLCGQYRKFRNPPRCGLSLSSFQVYLRCSMIRTVTISCGCTVKLNSLSFTMGTAACPLSTASVCDTL